MPKLTLESFTPKPVTRPRYKVSDEPKSIARDWSGPKVSFGHTRSEISRRSGYAYKRPAKMSDGEEERKTFGLLIKLGICAGVCTLALGLKLINTPAAEQLTQTVKNVITEEVDIDETLGKLKFVQNDIEAVFGAQSAIVMPAQGTVSRGFGDQGLEGVVMTVMREAPVVACADGTVREVGVSDDYGSFVSIEHTPGLETIAYGLKNIGVETGQALKKGDALGLAAGDNLYFEARLSGRPQDPLKLYETAQKLG